MSIPRSLALAASIGMATVLNLSAADAQSTRWTVEPASQGPCGDECYTPPTAWVYEPGGNFAFGVQCDGTMVLGGPAMAQPTPPFAAVEMVVDGRNLGQFSVQNGLNDVYVSPTLPGGVQDWTGSVRPALAGGSVLQLRLGLNALLEFGLGGSRAALDAVEAQCAAAASGGPAGTAQGDAAWPTSPAFPPGLEIRHGATIDGWTDSGYGGWLGNRASDGLELWVALFARGSDGVYVVVSPAGYTADGSVGSWRVVTSLYLPPDRQPPTPIAWGPCRSTDYQAQDVVYARWDGGDDPAEAWAFLPADARFERLPPGAFLCEYEEH